MCKKGCLSIHRHVGHTIKKKKNAFRLNLYGEADSYKIWGSKTSFCLYTIFILFILSFAILSARPAEFKTKDKYDSISHANNFTAPFNDFNMHDANFTPVFEIDFMSQISPK